METGLIKSIFKNGESTTSKDIFTKMWIELVNKLERRHATVNSKAACFVSKETEH